MAITIGDMVTSALSEIRIARAGDVLAPEAMSRGVYVFNRLVNLWNADHRKGYADLFTDYTLTPSLSPHTIGPGGTFNVTERPVALLDAAVNLGGSPPVLVPIDVQDAAWYKRQAIPGLTMSYPTDVYFQTAWPLGKLYFFPVPTTAYGVRLWTRVSLAAVVDTDTFSLPQGYQAALELTLAEELAPSFGQSLDDDLKTRARMARATVFGNNDDVPRIATCDSGIPSSDSAGAWFDINTRSLR